MIIASPVAVIRSSNTRAHITHATAKQTTGGPSSGPRANLGRVSPALVWRLTAVNAVGIEGATDCLS